MPFLYRTPLIVRRRQPYIDWANHTEGEPMMTTELANTPAVYLVDAPDGDPAPERLLEDYWPEIFANELAGWSEDEAEWPGERSREMFDQWFDVIVGQGVVDLDEEVPLTEDDLDAEDLAYATNVCAWCGTELTDGGREVSFAVSDRRLIEERAGLVLEVRVDDEHAPIGVVPDDESRVPGEDVVFHACSRDCMQALRKHVPPALRRHQVH
jgi:hypothetical protein